MEGQRNSWLSSKLYYTVSINTELLYVCMFGSLLLFVNVYTYFNIFVELLMASQSDR